jgi:hypothetical protein
MSLKEAFCAALGSTPLFTVGREQVAADDGPDAVRCELSALDQLACGVAELEFRTSRWGDGDATRARQVALALAARLTYLLEPVRLIEVDAEQQTAQVRSSPPQREEGRAAYYELLVSGGRRISLVRYEKTATGARQRVAAQLTREVVLRLVADLVTAAA